MSEGAQNSPTEKPRNWTAWLVPVVTVLPALAILVVAWPRLISGLAQDVAFPATAYMVADVPLPVRAYRQTAQALSLAPASDGETQLMRAEAALRAGEPRAVVAPIAESASSRAPADARGWIVLAEALQRSDPPRAAQALSVAIELAPREHFLVVPRLLAGAPLWSYLPPEARATLLDDAAALVQDKNGLPDLLALLRVAGGPALVTRALKDHPDEIRALNRRLVRARLGLR